MFQKVLTVLVLSLVSALNVGVVRCVSRDNKRVTNGRKLMVDIDGTICSKTNSEYEKSVPNLKKIEVFNTLYDLGYEVNYWTARGANSGLDWDDFTVKQLNEWGVKFTSINMGKPHYDVWIDDKALNAEDVCISKILVDKKKDNKYDECVLNSHQGCDAVLYQL